MIAGYSAAVKLNTFAITSFTTLGNGISNFTAQNLGAGETGRVKEGFLAGLRLTMAVAVCFFAAFFLFSGGMVRLFMGEESAAALHTGEVFLRIVSPFYFVVSVKLAADGVLRGAGAMKQFMASHLLIWCCVFCWRSCWQRSLVLLGYGCHGQWDGAWLRLCQ